MRRIRASRNNLGIDPRRTSDREAQVIEWRIPPMPADVEGHDSALVFTPGAVDSLITSIGVLPPETGAKLFGPTERFGVDRVEFDHAGSRSAGGSIYEPDTTWGDQRIDHWLAQEPPHQRLWTGDAHSHPGGIGTPSPKASYAQGDLGYVEAVFETNEVQHEFVIPILTHTGRSPSTVVTINPWVVLRSDASVARWADFVVSEVDMFPVRRFNPGLGLTAGDRERIPTLGVDLDQVVDRVATLGFGVPDLRVEQQRIVVLVGDRRIEVFSSDGHGPMFAEVDAGDGRTSKVGRTYLDATAPIDAEERMVGLIDLAIRDTRSRSTAPARRPAHSGPEAVIPESGARTTEWPASDYYARTEGLLTNAFHDTKILVVGASGGSYLIDKLSRLGPGQLVLIDHDIVEVPNLSRTVFTLDDVGREKVAVLRDRIARTNPLVDVVAVPENIFDLPPATVEELLDGVDVIVAGTDSFEAQAELNRWSLRSGSPSVFIDINAGAHGGIVRWQIPGVTACYRCMAAHRYDAFADDQTLVDLEGANGLLTDIQMVDMVAASIIVGLVERGQPTPKGRLIAQLCDRTEIIISNGPAYEFGTVLYRSLTSDIPTNEDRLLDLSTYLGMFPIVTLPCVVDPACPQCSYLHAVTGAATDGNVRGPQIVER